MRFTEKLEHKLRQYSYERKRNFSKYKKEGRFNSIVDSFLEILEDLDEMDAYIRDEIEEIDYFLPRRKK